MRSADRYYRLTATNVSGRQDDAERMARAFKVSLHPVLEMCIAQLCVIVTCDLHGLFHDFRAAPCVGGGGRLGAQAADGRQCCRIDGCL